MFVVLNKPVLRYFVVPNKPVWGILKFGFPLFFDVPIFDVVVFDVMLLVPLAIFIHILWNMIKIYFNSEY